MGTKHRYVFIPAFLVLMLTCLRVGLGIWALSRTACQTPGQETPNNTLFGSDLFIEISAWSRLEQCHVRTEVFDSNLYIDNSNISPPPIIQSFNLAIPPKLLASTLTHKFPVPLSKTARLAQSLPQCRLRGEACLGKSYDSRYSGAILVLAHTHTHPSGIPPP